MCKGPLKQIPEPETVGATHFHVSAIGATTAIPQVIVTTQADADEEYSKMINLVIDTTGANAVCWREQRVTFDNGCYVRWYECDKDCFHE